MSSRQRYRADIDGFRAFALVMVVVTHLHEGWLPGGFIGVDLFFVVSGYVVTGSLLNQKKDKGERPLRMQLADFYARRVRRLIPALLLVVATTLIVSAFFRPDNDNALQTGVSALFAGGNIELYLDQQEYFGGRIQDNPFRHTWSLGVEEQYYLIFPILFFPTAKLRARRRIAFFGVLAALSAVGYLLLIPVDRSASFYLMPFRFWEIAFGVLLMLVTKGEHGRWAPYAALPAFAFIIIAAIFPWGWGPWPLVGSVVATTVIVAGRGGVGIGRVLEHRAVVGLGQRSYSFYLWHWPVQVIGRNVFEESLTLDLACVAVMAGLTELSYRFVETPFRKANWGSSRTTIRKGLAASALTASLAAGVVLSEPFLGNPPADKWLDDIYGERCWPKKYDPAVSKACLDAPDAEKRIFFLGDSHARMLVPAVEKLGPPVSWLAMGSGCGMLPPELVDAEHEEENNCRAYNEDAVEAISRQVEPGDLVIIARYYHYATNQEEADHLAGYLERLAPRFAPATLVLLDDVPALPEDKTGFGCMKQPWKPNPSGCSLTLEQSHHRQRFNNQAIERVRASQPNVKVVRIHDRLCENGTCGAYLGSTFLYTDQNHLTVEGVMLLVPALQAGLADVL